ncbi:hypothetical protein QBC32DRAFT_200357, partial [Pseudoneurospora amorphoporcata]
VEFAIRYYIVENFDIPWPNVLPIMQYNMNNSLSTLVGITPNELVLGFKPNTALDLLKPAD